VTRHKIEIDDRILSYLEAGAGELVVLVHAFPLCAAMWEPQLASPPPGWRLIAPDLRGFGEARPHRKTGWLASSIDDYAADVMVLLTYLEASSAVIIGLSMGGYVAFGMLRAAPHRVRALVLADTRVGADREEAKRGRQQMQTLAEREGASAVAQALLLTLLGEDTLRERPQVVARVREMAEAAPPVAIATALECLMTRPDSTPELAAFRGPALIIRGAQDALMPAADAERMQTLIPGAASIEIPSSGHLPNWEQPEAFNRAWQGFLASRV
jgi:pimeloyl-ACP methyl ester carboxylesterase